MLHNNLLVMNFLHFIYMIINHLGISLRFLPTKVSVSYTKTKDYHTHRH